MSEEGTMAAGVDCTVTQRGKVVGTMRLPAWVFDGPQEETAELRETLARAAFDAFYAEGTPYSEIERALFLQVVDRVLAVLRPHLVWVTDDQRVMMTTALDGIERAVTEFEGAEQRRWITEYVSVLRAIAGRDEAGSVTAESGERGSQ